MKPIDIHTGKAFAKFSFLATLLVVMCHTDDVMPLKYKSSLVRFLGGSFSDANVCNFFFLSGFLLAKHFGEKRWWVNGLKKRISTLAIPYVVWCAICYAFLFFRNQIFPSAYDNCMEPASLIDEVRRVFGIGFLTNPCGFVLWYVKTLFYFILISPLVFPVLRRSFRTFCSIVSLILILRFVGYSFRLEIMRYFGFCFHLLGFIAFICGGWCALHNITFPERLKKSPLILPLAIWISTAALFFFWGNCVKGLYYIAAPINIAVSVFCLLWICFCTSWTFPAFLVKCSFFVYAAHLQVLKVCSKLLPPAPAHIHAISAIAFFVLFVASVIICVGVAHCTHFISPRFAALLSGGRFDKSYGDRKDTK